MDIGDHRIAERGVVCGQVDQNVRAVLVAAGPAGWTDSTQIVARDYV